MTSARHSDVFIGRVVDDRFEVHSFLGEGAVGAVYKSRDRNDGRAVALKIWSERGLNDQTRGRFAREATALSTLRHPNIVDVYGYGVIDGRPYVAMEYLQGDTLESLLGQGEPLDPTLALDVARQMLAALSYAHALGVVHRDLKPENVFLARGPNGRHHVKLLDYGLAKFLSPGDDPVKGALTMTGVMMGTPLYMPPEQAAGKAVDVRVDVYALGCVIFEMLSGAPPYLGETNAEILRAHMTAPVPSIEAARPGMRPAAGLQAFFDRALAKLADKRFENGAQMLDALDLLPRPLLRPLSIPAPAAPSSRPSAVTVVGAPAQPATLLPMVAGVALGLCVLAALAAVFMR
jgi:serine/threonine protein kinase